MYSPNQQQQFFDQEQSLNGLSAHTSVNAMPMQSYSTSHPTLPAAIARRRQSSFSSVMSPPLSAGPSSSSFDPANSQAWFGTSLDSTGSSFSQNMFGGRDIIVSPSTSTPMDGFGTADDDEAAQRNLQQMFEKRRRRRESHNAVERRRRDNINDKIQELSLLLPEHLLDNPPPGSTNVVTTPGAASGSAAQKAINKGTILKMSVDHIRNLRSDAARYQARIKELETMLEAAKSGEYVDFDTLQLGRTGQTQPNEMNAFPPQYQQHQSYGASAPVPLRSQQQSLNLNDSNRRPQPHQRTGSLQFQQQFGNLHIDANPRGADG
ncbi:helix-loop-helix DNA-binding domain-containing protein [Umbelopsis sp. AD052]|nr:helix-loop-helix DNA-binding domain-containing protein [Umbelopsis sp. AD052]